MMKNPVYGRMDRLIQERRHDSYRERRKWPEPTVCTECGAVFLNGRWTWSERPNAANSIRCPACQRAADRYPAGTLQLEGEFFSLNRDEILNLVRNVEELEKTAHPMERIMSIEEGDPATVIQTTGVHLARRIGDALTRAYQGTISLQYGDAEASVEVNWSR